MNNRQRAILEIIKSAPVLTQEDLQIRLKDAGFNVTQSTVSRDIKQLNIIKATDSSGRSRYVTASGGRYYGVNDKNRFFDSFKNSVIAIEYAMNNVVVKCHAGMASGAGVVIDELFSQHLIGSLAGDDTVIIVTKNEEESAFLTQKLRELL